MSRFTKAAGRFVLTWVAFGVIAAMLSLLYPSLVHYRIYVTIAFSLCAGGVAIHAAVRGTPRVDRSFKLLLALIPAWFLLSRLSRFGPAGLLPTLLEGYVYWTGLAALGLGFAYVVVYRLRLLDRDGPVGQRLGLA